MRVDPLLALRFEAWRIGQAVRAFTHRRIVLQPHALFVTALQFPGEDNTILAAAIGDRSRRAPLRILGTPDPRLREEEFETIARFAALLERYYRRCERDGVAPQLVLTSAASLRHLTNIADDLRFGERAPTVAAFATALSYFTMRAQVPDQQAVVVMTSVLRTHWVAPLEPTQEEHLGALVAAIAPPADLTVASAVLAAEQFPMGARTMPVFDRDVLRPALDQFHTARRRGASPEELAPKRLAIARVTAPVVERMYETLHKAADALDRASLAVLPEVPAWMQVEQEAFTDFRRATAAGIRTPRSDKPKGAAFRYAEREQADAVVSASVECHDTFGRTCAVMRGSSVEGQVADVRQVRVAGQRNRVTMVDVLTTQAALRVREGHELVDRSDHQVRYLVRGVRAEGPSGVTTTRLTLQMTAGMRRVGPPAAGTAVSFVREVPDLDRLGRIRRSLAQKLAEPHWTLGGPIPPPRAPGRAPALPADLPASPLRALETLR